LLPFGPAPSQRQLPRYNGHSHNNVGQQVIGQSCRWEGLGSTSAMGTTADGDGVKQADGSFLDW
jgi:hypothetical protein